MCGIGSITISQACTAPIDLQLGIEALLEELEHRGGHATGVMALDADNHLHVQKAALGAKAFIRDMRPIPADTRAVAVHTRFATKGPKEWAKNNHPVQCGNAWLVHNGVVDDSETARLKGDPWVDTFALSAAFSGVQERRKGESARQYAKRVGDALASVDGSAAIVCAMEGEAVMITARLHGSPLFFAECEGVRIAASTRKAVEDAADAMELELPSKLYEVTTHQGKHKTTKEEWREDISMAEEGRVLSWQDGKHNRLTVTLPERTFKKPWKAAKKSGYSSYDELGYNLYRGQDFGKGSYYTGKVYVEGKGWVEQAPQASDNARPDPAKQPANAPQYPDSFKALVPGSPEYNEMRKLFQFWRLSAHGVKWAQKHPQSANAYDQSVERAKKHASLLPFPTPREAQAYCDDPLYTREQSEAKTLANPSRPTSTSAARFVGDSCGVTVTGEDHSSYDDLSMSAIVDRMLSDRGTEHHGYIEADLDGYKQAVWRRCDLCNFECDDVEHYIDGALCGDCARLWAYEGGSE